MAKVSKLKVVQQESPSYEIVLVTPDLAAQWLRLNKSNRPLRRAKIEQWAAIMERGDWMEEHIDAITFDVDGNLINGQHRLFALQRTGKSFRMRVIRGVPKEMAHVIDVGTARTLRDSLTIDQGQTVSVATSQLMPRFVSGLYLQVPSDLPYNREEMAGFYEKYRDTFETVMALFVLKKKGVSQVGVRAVVARAWISLPEQRDRIREFVEVLMAGRYSSIADSAALVLRDYLIAHSGKTGAGLLFENYAKANQALMAFINHRPMQKLTSATRENFPLSEDKDLFDQAI